MTLQQMAAKNRPPNTQPPTAKEIAASVMDSIMNGKPYIGPGEWMRPLHGGREYFFANASWSREPAIEHITPIIEKALMARDKQQRRSIAGQKRKSKKKGK